MSSFTIPGLGFAKPNEQLPPLPADVLAAAASVQGTTNASETPQHPTPAPQQQQTDSAKDATPNQPAETQSDPDAMNIDSAPSPPSLMSALEASLGLPEPMSTEQDGSASGPAQAPTQAQPDNQNENENENEHPEWEIDSSPYESSSEESSSSDSSSDDEGDNEGYELMGVDETARMLMEGASDDEGEGGSKGTGSSHLRTKNEVAPEAIPKPNITITPEMKVEPLGLIDQVVENIAVVKAFTPGEYQVLDTGSVLCTEDRAVFGVIAETIGKVLQPMYTVLFSTADDVKAAGLQVGTKVFYPVDHASYVFTQPLRNLKGSDASNIHDEEVAEDEMEFSDDEKEAEHKRQTKQKRKEGKAGRGGGGGGGSGAGPSGRGGREPHPLRNEVKPDNATTAGGSGGLNYDDEDDGPYRPLTRPASFGQGPPIQQNFIQEPEPQPRFGAYRGRADSRGRGHRGRGDRGRGGRGRGGGRGGFQHGGSGGGSGGESRDGYSMPAHGGQWQQSSSQQQQQPSPAYQQAQAPAPSQAQPNPATAFNFSMPAPQPGQGGFVPPPPPNWNPAQANHQTGQQPGGQQNAQGAYLNPAFLAALLGQMQQGKPPQPPPQ